MDFRFEVVDDGQSKSQLVYMRGALVGESLDFLNDLETKLVEPTVFFDTEDINLVSSAGLTHWIIFVDKLKKLKKNLVYRKCSDVFVTAINTIPDLTKNVKVESVYIPYTCAECSNEQRILVHSDVDVKDLDPYEKPCQNCGTGQLMSAVLLEDYFHFRDDEDADD